VVVTRQIGTIDDGGKGVKWEGMRFFREKLGAVRPFEKCSKRGSNSGDRAQEDIVGTVKPFPHRLPGRCLWQAS
jgi:hypothetical protein